MDCGKGGADDGYWVGFDCAHAGDKPDPELFHLTRTGKMLAEQGKTMKDIPEILRRTYEGFGDDQVRTQEYVIQECRDLIEQAIAAAK